MDDERLKQWRKLILPRMTGTCMWSSLWASVCQKYIVENDWSDGHYAQVTTAHMPVFGKVKYDPTRTSLRMHRQKKEAGTEGQPNARQRCFGTLAEE